MTENINFQINDGQQFAQDDHDMKLYMVYFKNEFKGFGNYNNELWKENEGRIEEKQATFFNISLYQDLNFIKYNNSIINDRISIPINEIIYALPLIHPIKKIVEKL